MTEKPRAGHCRKCQGLSGHPDSWFCSGCSTDKCTELHGPTLVRHAAILGVPVYRTRVGHLPARITDWN